MKLIPLTKGKFAKVDDEDYSFLVQRKWFFSSHGYAKTGVLVSDKDKFFTTQIYMHILINKTPKGTETDHIDHDKLNNQKYNLRSSNSSQNSFNMSHRKGGSSKYRGVSWSKEFKKWEVKISCNGKSKFIGRYEDEVIAGRNYDIFALKLHGNYANINGV